MSTALVTETAETTTDQASHADTVRCPDCGLRPSSSGAPPSPAPAPPSST